MTVTENEPTFFKEKEDRIITISFTYCLAGLFILTFFVLKNESDIESKVYNCYYKAFMVRIKQIQSHIISNKLSVLRTTFSCI